MNNVKRDGADCVTSARRIHQTNNNLTVPACYLGHIEDEADGYLFVDFGEPYGTVLCEPDDLQCWSRKSGRPTKKSARVKKARSMSDPKAMGWDAAIAEAEDQVRRAKYRILVLEGAIRVFQLRKEAGEAWPR